jgi:4-hydroxythreonine-4-phosphate dehydrogenase
MSANLQYPLTIEGRTASQEHNDMQRKPILGLTMGDPAGIGPEIIVKAWADKEMQQQARFLVIGDAAVIRNALVVARIAGNVRAVQSVGAALFGAGALDVLDLHNVDTQSLVVGEVQPQAGQAAYEAVVRAAELAMAGEIDAVVTPPLNKEAMNLAGQHYDGHTGLLKALTEAPSVTMMLVAGSFRVTHVSTHCPLREAIERVQRDRIIKVIELTQQALRRMGIDKPRLAVAGLNPHAGEGGLFGDEEVREIKPAIDAARASGYAVEPDPVPPDTVFYRMAERQEYDAVVAMYHDQGHIPTKLIGFSEGVNVTLGLPIIRTSVDHGTAFDIAGQGIADETSLKRAIEVAVAMSGGGR